MNNQIQWREKYTKVIIIYLYINSRSCMIIKFFWNFFYCCQNWISDILIAIYCVEASVVISSLLEGNVWQCKESERERKQWYGKQIIRNKLKRIISKTTEKLKYFSLLTIILLFTSNFLSLLIKKLKLYS